MHGPSRRYGVGPRTFRLHFSALSRPADSRRTMKPKIVPKIAFYIGLNKFCPYCTRNRTKFSHRPDPLRRIDPAAGFRTSDRNVFRRSFYRFPPRNTSPDQPPSQPRTQSGHAARPDPLSTINRCKISDTRHRDHIVNTSRETMQRTTLPLQDEST